MPKRSSKSKSVDNSNQSNALVSQIVTQSTAGDGTQPVIASLDGKNPAAVALGRLGGLKGGKARAAKLSAEERSRIARAAASARWNRNNE